MRVVLHIEQQRDVRAHHGAAHGVRGHGIVRRDLRRIYRKSEGMRLSSQYDLVRRERELFRGKTDYCRALQRRRHLQHIDHLALHLRL